VHFTEKEHPHALVVAYNPAVVDAQTLLAEIRKSDSKAVMASSWSWQQGFAAMSGQSSDTGNSGPGPASATTVSDASLDKFARVFEASAKRWEVIFYPSLLRPSERCDGGGEAHTHEQETGSLCLGPAARGPDCHTGRLLLC
jgi:hypothetical protein